MIRPGYPRLTVGFPDAVIGTPPFSFGFNFGESSSSGDLQLVTDEVRDWWESDATVLGYLTQDLGIPTITAQGIYGGVLVEAESLTGDAPTGSPMDLPGVSVRFLQLGNRPVGGRRGSFFVPGLEGAGSDQDGILNGTYRANLIAWGQALQTSVESAFAGATMVTLHTIDSVESETVTIDITVSPTVSFLQRRYR